MRLGLGFGETYNHLGLKISARFLHRGQVVLALVSHGTRMLTAVGAGAILTAVGLVLAVKMTVLIAEAEIVLLKLDLLDLLDLLLLALVLMLMLVLLIGR